jgi:hypothetical protein
LGVDVCAVLKEQAHDVCVSLEGRQNEGCLAILVASVDVGAVLYEQAHDICVSVLGCQDEGCIAFVVTHVDVNTILKNGQNLGTITSRTSFYESHLRNVIVMFGTDAIIFYIFS